MERQGFLFLVSSTSFGRLTIVSLMANRRERQTNSGVKLRAIRQQLGWSMREVHTATVALAKKHRQPAFVIAPSRLHDIESKNKIPGIHRLYALALIYGRTLKEILSLYGIPL
ncbi:MAG TPA: helix-turn-helix transcriptional regulator [Nitrososphaera sp.]|nr:helix-turn-helix transcriptional regulator [Nitrososphaera sp.]